MYIVHCIIINYVIANSRGLMLTPIICINFKDWDNRYESHDNILLERIFNWCHVKETRLGGKMNKNNNTYVSLYNSFFRRTKIMKWASADYEMSWSSFHNFSSTEEAVVQWNVLLFLFIFPLTESLSADIS